MKTLEFSTLSLSRAGARWLLLASLCAALGSLSGCAVVLGGAVLTGGLVATDRRTSGTQLEDEGIELRGASRLNQALGERGHINLSAYNRQVLMTGEVPTEADKQLAEQTLAKVENVRAVVNELAVLGNSSVAARGNDVFISGKVRAGFVDAKELSANAFRVVTERSTVYLMGLVTQREADKATEIARSTSGVQRVVRIFETISEQDLQRIAGQPGKPAQQPK